MSVSDGRPLDLGLLNDAVFLRYSFIRCIFALNSSAQFTQHNFSNVTKFILSPILVPHLSSLLSVLHDYQSYIYYYTDVPITDLHLELLNKHCVLKPTIFFLVNTEVNAQLISLKYYLLIHTKVLDQQASSRWHLLRRNIIRTHFNYLRLNRVKLCAHHTWSCK